MIRRDGRGVRHNEGPGVGLMAHRIGEGASSLIDGPGPMDRAVVAAVVAPREEICACGDVIVVGDPASASAVELAVGLHRLGSIHAGWLEEVAHPPARPRDTTTFGLLPIDEIYLLQEFGPDLARTFAIRPLESEAR